MHLLSLFPSLERRPTKRHLHRDIRVRPSSARTGLKHAGGIRFSACGARVGHPPRRRVAWLPTRQAFEVQCEPGGMRTRWGQKESGDVSSSGFKRLYGLPNT